MQLKSLEDTETFSKNISKKIGTGDIIFLYGEIGTGKTTISNMFSDKGVPVFNSDEIAKEIMSSNHALKNQIIEVFGVNAYENNKLNRSYLSNPPMQKILHGVTPLSTRKVE